MPDHGYAAPRHAVVTLPNIISFARLCAVPLAIWLVLRDHFRLAFFLFAAAGLSDLLDGWLARRAGGTVLGAALDPLADKALMVGMYVTLAAIGQLPDWLAILVVFRDVVIVGGVILLWMTEHGTHIRPIFISKLNTALQLVLVGVVLGLDAAGLDAAPLRLGLIWLVAGTTLLSGGAYVGRTARAA
jgi:cardiolipin synthase